MKGNPHACEAAMERALAAARENLSYSAVNQRLDSLFHRIAR